VSDQVQFGIANYSKDSYIVVEGNRRSECFFIIQQGKVQISREITVEDDKAEVLVPGDFFGVASAMSSLSPIDTAIALTDVVLIAVRPQQYVPLIQRNPQIATKILMQLSIRLRFLNEALAKLTMKNTEAAAGETPARLFDVGEYYFKQKQFKQAFYAHTKYLKYCPKDKNRAAATNRLEGLAARVKGVKTEYGKDELNRAYNKDDMIFAAGEPGDEFFVLQTGSVRISKIVENKEVLLATLKEGDIFGEMAILEGKPRTASAIAGENCSVMAVSKSNFEVLIKGQPQLIGKLTTLLSNRIWSTFKHLEVIHITNPLGRIYGALLIQLEKSRVNLESKGGHVFTFTWDDVIHMLGLSEKGGFILMGELHKDKNIQVKNGRIHALSIHEVVRQAELYRKIDERGKTVQENRHRSTPISQGF